MLTVLSILASTSLAGFLFCLLKLYKINKIKKTNLAEPIANKKWRRVLLCVITICSLVFIAAVATFFILYP